jgi:protein SCO1/2
MDQQPVEFQVMTMSSNPDRRTVLGAALLSLLPPAARTAHSAPAAPAPTGSTPSAVWPAGHDYQRSIRPYAVPEVVLVDADARPVRLRELLATDDAVMMNFVFTTCNAVCPIMVKVFADVPERLGPAARTMRMISISIDPDQDTPAQLKAYAKRFGADKRWTFLTGPLQDIKRVQLAFDSYRGDKMNHEPLTLMRSAGAKLWVRIDGFASPDELVREFRKGQAL